MEAKAPIAFDIVRKGIAPVVYSMQGDSNTRSIFISLFNDSIPWQVPADVSIAVAYKKPDGSKGLYDKLPNGKEAITVSGSSVKAIFAPQMLTVPGEVIASVVFFDKDINRLSTFPFIVMVTSDPSSGKQVSNDYYKFSTMEEVSKAVDDAIAALEADKQDFLAKAEEALEIVHGAATAGAPAVVCEATGQVIRVDDSIDRPLQGLTLYGKTTQNGTPTPEAPVELVSAGESGAINTTVCGKNLYSGGDVVVSSAYVGYQVIQFPVYTGYPQFTVSFNPNGFAGNLACLAMNGKSFTLSGTESRATMVITPDKTNSTGMLFYNATEANAFINFTDIQIEFGNTATAYEPYKAQTLTASTPSGLPGIPVSSGGNYTDENGQQWICDEIDFARGLYVQRVEKSIYDGSDDENWRLSTGITSSLMFKKSPVNLAIPLVNSVKQPIMCDALKTYAFYGTGHTNWELASPLISDGIALSFNEGLNVKFGSIAEITDLASFKVYLASHPITVIGKLNTPIETALSDEELTTYAALHTNKPNTTIYNDAGAGLKLGYIADTKAYIDNKFTELQNAILSAGANI